MTHINSVGRSALILVDLQYDFVEGGALAVAEGLSLIPIANRLMSRFDVVVATQDWHPADHQSFASQHLGVTPGQIIELNGLAQIAWPDHCIQGTRGAELVSELDRTKIDRVIQKGSNRMIDSYSGFFDNDHQQGTGLIEYLRQESIDRVSIMGLATDYCVRFTALDAIQLGLRTSLIVDGCRGVELHPGDVQRAMEQMKSAGIELVSS